MIVQKKIAFLVWISHLLEANSTKGRLTHLIWCNIFSNIWLPSLSRYFQYDERSLIAIFNDRLDILLFELLCHCVLNQARGCLNMTPKSGFYFKFRLITFSSIEWQRAVAETSKSSFPCISTFLDSVSYNANHECHENPSATYSHDKEDQGKEWEKILFRDEV